MKKPKKQQPEGNRSASQTILRILAKVFLGLFVCLWYLSGVFNTCIHDPNDYQEEIETYGDDMHNNHETDYISRMYADAGLTSNDGEYVYICHGPKAIKYHRSNNCKGLRKCSASPTKISIDNAKKIGCKPCRICYR